MEHANSMYVHHWWLWVFQLLEWSDGIACSSSHLLTFANLIPVRGRSPWLPCSILLWSGRALGRAGVVSDRSALGPSTSVWAIPRGLFPPSYIVVTCFATFVSSLLITWPYHERRFWVTYVVIGLTIASLLNLSFLIRSFLVLPWIHLSIFMSVVCILCWSVLWSAQHPLPYIKVGVMTVVYSLFFSLTVIF